MKKRILTLSIFVLITAFLFLQLGNVQGSSQGLVGYWSFDNINGTTVVDDSGNGNDSTIVNNASVVEGKVGSALEFDGTNNQYTAVAYNSSLDVPTVFTLSAWVYWKGSNFDNSTQFIFNKRRDGNQDNYYFFINNNGTVGIGVEDGTDDSNHEISTNDSINENEWIHFIVLFDGTRLKIYENGILSKEGSDISSNTPWYTGAGDEPSLTIGRLASDSDNRFFKGIIDELKIYNRALTEAEIEQEYEGNGWEKFVDKIIYLGGKVGIGTTNPTEKLHLKGNFRIDGNIVSDSDICIGVCE